MWVWPVSARTPKALAAQAERLREHLVSHPDLDLADVAYSLAVTRAQHPYRAAITANRRQPRTRAGGCWAPCARWAAANRTRS